MKTTATEKETISQFSNIEEIDISGSLVGQDYMTQTFNNDREEILEDDNGEFNEDDEDEFREEDGTELEENVEVQCEEDGTYDFNDAPIIGRVFSTPEDAYIFYNSYAKLKGFGVRRRNSNRSQKTNELYKCKFVCSKQGFKNLNDKRVDQIRVKRRRDIQ